MVAPCRNPHLIYQEKMNGFSLHSPWPPPFAFVAALSPPHLVSGPCPALNCELFKGRNCCDHTRNAYNAVAVIFCADYTGC